MKNKENIKYKENLEKTMEIIDTCFTLKAIYIKKKNPDYIEQDIEKEIFNGILRRKENKWK